MPHLTTEELKKLREWITPEWKFEKGKALPGSIPSHDAALIAAAPDLLSELISLREKMEGLRSDLVKLKSLSAKVKSGYVDALDDVIFLLDR